MRACTYHKCGKIRWTKHTWFQPYEVFHRNTFAMPWLASSVYYLTITKYSWESFHVTPKNCKSLAQRIFPCLQYACILYEIVEVSSHQICQFSSKHLSFFDFDGFQ